MRHIFSGLLLFILTCISNAQSVDDDAFGYYDYALRFSRNQLIGSSRIQGMGGAQVALGADISSQVVNPAGLGLYRKSDWGISIANEQYTTESTLTTTIDETSNRNSNGSLNIPNIGFIFGSKEDDPNSGPWKSQALGITMSRLASYRRKFSYSGRNRDFSLRNFLVGTANGTNFNNYASQFEDGLVDNIWGAAYYAWILNAENEGGTPDEQSNYFTFDPDKEDIIDEQIDESGRSMQWNLGYGANYEDVLFLGGNIGVLSVRQEIRRTYSETLVETDIHDLRSFTYEENEITRGLGVNFSIGAIFRPNNTIRLGLTYQSPTYLNMDEEFDALVNATYNNVPISSQFFLNDLTYSTRRFLTEYRIRTPSRISLGSAYFFQNKKGFLTADVDFIPYQNMVLDSEFDPFQGDNNTINSIYRTAMNLRLGGEYRYEQFRFRLGYAHVGNPYRSGFDVVNIAENYLTLGAGLRFQDFYIDLSHITRIHSSGYKPYAFEGGGEPVANLDYRNTRLTITAGMLF